MNALTERAIRTHSITTMVRINQAINQQIVEHLSLCKEFSPTVSYISNLLHEALPLAQDVLREPERSFKALNDFIGKNRMILARLEHQPTDSGIPGIDQREELRKVLCSTRYMITSRAETYITEIIGPAGLSDFDVKSMATTVTAIACSRHPDELPYSYESRVWHGRIRREPSNSSKFN